VEADLDLPLFASNVNRPLTAWFVFLQATNDKRTIRLLRSFTISEISIWLTACVIADVSKWSGVGAAANIERI
jgi:hypothetical protein